MSHLSRKEAYTRATKAKKKKDEEYFLDLLEKVAEFANKGWFFLGKAGYVPDSVRTRLEELGYKVEQFTEMPHFCISWSDEDTPT